MDSLVCYFYAIIQKTIAEHWIACETFLISQVIKLGLGQPSFWQKLALQQCGTSCNIKNAKFPGAKRISQFLKLNNVIGWHPNAIKLSAIACKHSCFLGERKNFSGSFQWIFSAVPARWVFSFSVKYSSNSFNAVSGVYSSTVDLISCAKPLEKPQADILKTKNAVNTKDEVMLLIVIILYYKN